MALAEWALGPLAEHLGRNADRLLTARTGNRFHVAPHAGTRRMIANRARPPNANLWSILDVFSAEKREIGGLLWLDATTISTAVGDVAQLVRVPDCRSGGCGFESRRPRFTINPSAKRRYAYLSAVESAAGSLNLLRYTTAEREFPPRVPPQLYSVLPPPSTERPSSRHALGCDWQSTRLLPRMPAVVGHGPGRRAKAPSGVLTVEPR